MKHILSLGLCIGAAMMLSGCGQKGPSHESIVIDMIESVKAATEAMNGVHDEASTRQASLILKQQTAKLRELHHAIVSLGKANASQIKRVRKHDQEVLVVAEKSLQAGTSMTRIIQSGQIPAEAGREALMALHELGRVMKEFGEEADRLTR